MALLEVHNLKTYFDTEQGEYKAVDDVSFTLEQGESLGLVGESGCGKTTTALSISRLLPKEGRIAGGSIVLDGVDLTKLSNDEMRARRWKEVSIVFQGAMNALNPVMKVGEQIAEAIVLHEKTTKQEAMRQTGELFELVEIPLGRIHNYPHEFSGGMKQRVMIAMALACNPKVIIGDEPTTALDVMIQAQIIKLLGKIRKERNMGLLLITHDLAILGETCDKIAVMYGGKIVEYGTVEDIFKNTAHPYTKSLIACFPHIGKEKVIPPSIEGTPPNLFAPPSGCAFHPRCPWAVDVCKVATPGAVSLKGIHVASCHRVLEVRDGK